MPEQPTGQIETTTHYCEWSDPTEQEAAGIPPCEGPVRWLVWNHFTAPVSLNNDCNFWLCRKHKSILNRSHPQLDIQEAA